MTSTTATFTLILLGATATATLSTASCGGDDPAPATTGPGGSGSGGTATGTGMGGEGGGDGSCTSDSDCPGDEVCEQNTCVDPSCTNGELDGDESDVDCGGGCLPCDDGEDCNDALDCASGFCESSAGGSGGSGGGTGGMGGSGGSGGSGGDTGGTGGNGGAGGSVDEGGVCAPCGDDVDCEGSPGTYCEGGSCVPQKGLGESCAAHSQCGSGFCPEDGVCCDANCLGTCEACTEAATGASDGTCAPVSMGTDPDGECAATAATSCGASGDGCNGDAAEPGCILYDTDTSCASATCSAGEETDERFCDGDGTCAASAPMSCGAYACDDAGTACETTCTTNADCASTHYCDSGSCVAKKGSGSGCTTGDECQSGFCPGDDGVCCDAACDGTCVACLMSKTGSANGTCANVTGNTDPDNECALSCNGNGQCSIL